MGKGRGWKTEVSPTFADSPGDLVVVLQAPTAAFQTALTPTRSALINRRDRVDELIDVNELISQQSELEETVFIS